MAPRAIAELAQTGVNSAARCPPFRADPARSIAARIILGTHLGHEGHFCTPPSRGAANVRATGTCSGIATHSRREAKARASSLVLRGSSGAYGLSAHSNSYSQSD